MPFFVSFCVCWLVCLFVLKHAIMHLCNFQQILSHNGLHHSLPISVSSFSVLCAYTVQINSQAECSIAPAVVVIVADAVVVAVAAAAVALV